jgi:hypothetical protein
MDLNMMYNSGPDRLVMVGQEGARHVKMAHPSQGTTTIGHEVPSLPEAYEKMYANQMAAAPWIAHPGLAFPPHFPSSIAKLSWRKGKWTEEEEAFTKKLIEAFNDGLLKIPSGTTLRSFLSEKLCW